MSFADPQSVTISGTPISLPRTSVGDDQSEYTSADGLVQEIASHSLNKGGRTRRLLRIDHSKIAPDPFRPADNRSVSMSNYIVFDLPPYGYTAAEALAVYTGFKAQFTATSDLLITKLLGGES